MSSYAHFLLRTGAGAQVRGLTGTMARRQLSIPGSYVARRFKQVRSAGSRAAQQVDHDSKLMLAAIDPLKREGRQR